MGEGGKSAPWGGSGRLWKRNAGLGAGGWKEAGSPGGEKDTRDPERVSYCLLFPPERRRFQAVPELGLPSQRQSRGVPATPGGFGVRGSKSWEELASAASRAGRRLPRRASRRLRLGLPTARPPVQPAVAAPRAGREAPRDVSVDSFPPPALTPSASPPPARSRGQARREGAGRDCIIPHRLQHSQREQVERASETRARARQAPGRLQWRCPGDMAARRL